MSNSGSRNGPELRRTTRPGFATRLLIAQALVLVAGALTTWMVASAIGPSIFQDHLESAGVAHKATEANHVEEAFAASLLISLLVALLVAAAMALAVTWYFSHRVQCSIAAVADSASQVAAGHYSARVPRPGLGGEFDQLAITFNTLADRLDTVETTRRRMLADLAHEMRTPLATLDAHLEALEDGVRKLDTSTLSVLRSSTHRLGRLAQDIAAVSRAQEGDLEIHREPTSPQGLVDAANRAARASFRDKGVTLVSEVSTDAVVHVDPARIGQVLGNLLDNALRHTPPGGTVTLGSRATDRWVDLVVRDSGEGIEPEHLGHIFDRFYRADTARNRVLGGSGIGLTITKALVEAHGGTISVTSAGSGEGATFTIHLPRGPR